ncbi:non-specific lipid transfer protein GPI-anchored 2 isoform X1 [Vigna radiata var. radiata]|uniref:Non-specific lipid transfer protein GPI-anchored 2 isoform X1 n=1 Tax=Vigna radiata var. radiata TaxID=3916 RepID=A0A3Q0EHU5_VIGRR|nr:non-specific lipid transfer protein GPI-anchored 2 isoform X1 [Vigna radiata var. radiata]
MTAEVVSMVMNNSAASALVLVVLVSSAAAAAAAIAEGCREDLIAFSGCLAYVSYPPNNLTESPSEKCCMAFSRAVESVCLCYVVGDPLILGFPLNTTRLFSLSSLCPSPFSTSFPSLCSNSSALPPLAAASNQTLGTSVSESFIFFCR